MSEQAIYDFEGVISTAMAYVFTQNGFNASTYTVLTPADFQRKRPRVEVKFVYGGETTPMRWSNDGTQRNMAHTGELILLVLTDSNTTGKSTHAVYRAKVRNFCATIMPLINGPKANLPYHKILKMVQGPTSMEVMPEKGFEASQLTFQIDFCIMTQGLAQLPPAQPVDNST